VRHLSSGNVILSDRGADTLSQYLNQHEDDIACGINDFGDLKGLFIEMFGRSAREHKKQGE
jgi:hypothetical protein